MMKNVCVLKIDNISYDFEVEGEFFWGEEKLLFDKENSVISKTDWKDDGYCCVKVFENDDFNLLKESILDNIKKALRINKVNFDEKTFSLENYHEVVNTDDLHAKIINITKNLTNNDFNFDIGKLTDYFSDLLGHELTSWIEELNKTHVQIRINRPNSLDINPPHRDSYLSYYKDIVNVWIPIENCNDQTSLPLISGSHLIPENNIFRTKSKGAIINNNTYYVPCILKTKDGILQMERPNPKKGEALVFTPFLIHGAAINRSNKTRVSLELRFPRIDS